jgi:hypothetical protein
LFAWLNLKVIKLVITRMSALAVILA